MFTVLRLEFREGKQKQLEEVSNELNRELPNNCEGEDREPHRTSCVLAQGLQLQNHLEQVVTCFHKIEQIISNYNAFIIHKELDILIEPDDFGKSAFEELIFHVSFLQMLAKHSVNLTITISHP